MLGFADDVAIITQNYKEMETALEVFWRTWLENKLEKTKIMIYQKSQQGQRLQIQVRNNYIEQVNRYKYLGSLITY